MGKDLKIKLKELLLLKGYADDESAGLIMSGKVIVDGKKETRMGILVGRDAKIEILGAKKYVARSAEKLLGALLDFGIDVSGRVCMDLGSSTGGFVQVLLERGAKIVYAVDVGYGILDYSLRSDSRVVVLERHNVRNLEKSWFRDEDMASIRGPGAKNLFVSCDISFMSVRTVLKSVEEFLKSTGIKCEGVFLIKPQFEDSRSTEEGILTDETLRNQIVDDVRQYALSLGFDSGDIRPARIKGTTGNQEYVMHLVYQER